MNELESQEATARELVSLSKQRGIDLSSTFYDFAFFNEGRFILLWRKDGRILYNLQGKVNLLPERYKASDCVFRGMWHETGSVADLEEALDLLRAWMIDWKEVDDLPQRAVRSVGVG